MWLVTCIASHHACRSNVKSRLPTRLIDVTRTRRDGAEGVRLVQTSPSQVGTYACPSHCWGKVDIKCCTTEATLDKAIDFIECNSMPQNFRDAIVMARRFQIRFIWIDSICIIQDNAYDWEVESAKMADIYRNSHITFAAAASADSTRGCFTKTCPDLCLHISQTDGNSYSVGARTCDIPEAKTRLPLLERGWVYQELLISPRVLYFNYGRLSFRCLENHSCECGSLTLHPHRVSRGLIKSTNRLLMANALPVPHSSIYFAWRSMVSAYMVLSLTKLSDILPAISGLARVISELTHDQYLAGIWKGSFAIDLLWRNNSSTRKARAEWTAPTWSWASVPAGQQIDFLTSVNTDHLHEMLAGSVDDICCTPKGANDLGELIPGTDTGNWFPKTQSATISMPRSPFLLR